MLYKLQLKSNKIVSNNVLYQVHNRSDGMQRCIIQMNDKIVYDQILEDADEFIKTSLMVLNDFGQTLEPMMQGDIYEQAEDKYKA